MKRRFIKIISMGAIIGTLVACSDSEEGTHKGGLPESDDFKATMVSAKEALKSNDLEEAKRLLTLALAERGDTSEAQIFLDLTNDLIEQEAEAQGQDEERASAQAKAQAEAEAAAKAQIQAEAQGEAATNVNPSGFEFVVTKTSDDLWLRVYLTIKNSSNSIKNLSQSNFVIKKDGLKAIGHTRDSAGFDTSRDSNPYYTADTTSIFPGDSQLASFDYYIGNESMDGYVLYYISGGKMYPIEQF